MVVTMGDEYYRQRAAMTGRRVRRESDARRDLERMHLMTIRREKMRLHDELDRVRLKRKETTTKAGQNAKMLSNRFGQTLNASDDGRNRQRPRLNTANTPQRARSPYALRQTMTRGQSAATERELPQIGPITSPLKGELEMRKHKDEIRDPNTKLNELKKNEGRQKNLLSLKVDMFTRSLSPVSPARSPARSPAQSPPTRSDCRLNDIDETDAIYSEYELAQRKHGDDLESRASFPPSTRKKYQRMSLVDYDIIDGKQPLPKRLVPLESQDVGVGQGIARPDDVLPLIPTAQTTSPNQFPRRPTIIRRESQVAILERGDMKKKNKYSTTKAASFTTSSSNNNNNDSKQPKRTVESELNLAVLGRDAKRVKEIIENPEIVFDQEKYAPDGALRTMHMLPGADSAYSQARTARYLRWRDPNEADKERELSINEIFAKGKSDH